MNSLFGPLINRFEWVTTEWRRFHSDEFLNFRRIQRPQPFSRPLQDTGSGLAAREWRYCPGEEEEEGGGLEGEGYYCW